MRVYGAIALSVALISSAGAQTNEISAYSTLPGGRDFVAIGSDNPELGRALVQDPSRLYPAARSFPMGARPPDPTACSVIARQQSERGTHSPVPRRTSLKIGSNAEHPTARGADAARTRCDPCRARLSHVHRRAV